MSSVGGNSFLNGVEFISSERVDNKDALDKIKALKHNANADGINNLIVSEKSNDGSETTTVSNFKLDNTSFSNVDLLKKSLIDEGYVIEFIDNGFDDKQVSATPPVIPPEHADAIYNKICAIQKEKSNDMYNIRLSPDETFKLVATFNAIKENKDNLLDENSLNQSIEKIKLSTKKPVERFKYVLSYTKNPLPVDQPPDAVSHMLSARWQPKNYENMKKDFIEFTGLKNLTDVQFSNILSNFEGYFNKSYGVTHESLIEHSGLKHIAKPASEK